MIIMNQSMSVNPVMKITNYTIMPLQKNKGIFIKNLLRTN